MTRPDVYNEAVLRDVCMRPQQHRLVPPGHGSNPEHREVDLSISAVHREGHRELHRAASSGMTGTVNSGPVPRDTRQQGSAAGFEAGSEAGPKAGSQAGSQTGRHAGYQEGYQEGYQAGYDVGHESGLNAGREAGEQAGREAGLEAGKQAGAQALNEIIKATLLRQSECAQDADRLIAGLKEAVAQRLQAVESDLVELAYGAVCRIIGMAAFSREGVLALMRQALSGLPSRTLEAIRVSPHDHAWIEADANWKQQASGTSGREVQWLADERVPRGGCIVVSADGSLDARLETQLRQLRELLLDVHDIKAQGAEAEHAGAYITRTLSPDEHEGMS